MPTVRRIGSARFFFYSDERDEPPHIHVEQAGAIAKFWLVPVSLAASARFRRHDLRYVERLVHEHRQAFLKAWCDFFKAQ
jgi:hypothetical protein